MFGSFCLFFGWFQDHASSDKVCCVKQPKFTVCCRMHLLQVKCGVGIQSCCSNTKKQQPSALTKNHCRLQMSLIQWVGLATWVETWFPLRPVSGFHLGAGYTPFTIARAFQDIRVSLRHSDQNSPAGRDGVDHRDRCNLPTEPLGRVGAGRLG